MTKPLVIDRREFAPRPRKNLLEVCLELGFDLPYFCWHPGLGSVGACRQCAVKQFRDDRDEKGKLVMACMTAASEGVRISVDDPEARAFRASVIEWLMTNHPHDCPVCDEGGECHLQDMTVMTGHAYRRHRGPKRTYRNQDLGPFLNHEMNRCITCYRCVRFYRDYAGGDDLQAFASKNHVYFGRARDGTLENPFSGNLAEVCPTGVFTDRSLKRHYARKWDLQSAPSVCAHCAVGCNTFVGERYGSLRRVANRYHDAVNGYFLCDRGRYGYEFVNAGDRLREPLARRHGATRPATADAALAHILELLTESERVLGVGSPRASLESNFALRELVGESNFVLGVPEAEARLAEACLRALREQPLRAPALREVEDCDAVVVLGEDVLATAPRLALALRQAARNRCYEHAGGVGVARWDDAGVRTASQGLSSPVYLATATSTGLDDLASGVWRAGPDELARFGFALAHELDPAAPAVEGLDPQAAALAREAAHGLRAARRPLVVSGTGCASESLVAAAIQVALALRAPGEAGRLSLVVPESNSLGLALIGGQPLSRALEASAERGLALVVLENDLYRRAPAAQVDALLERARVVLLDHSPHATTRRAEVCLPAASFAEASGTLVSAEGRAQRFLRALHPEDEVRDAWHWIGRIAGTRASDLRNPWGCLDDVLRACASTLPALRGIVEAAPPADFRLAHRRIPRDPPRYSGRTAMRADRSVHEPPPPEDADSGLAFSMEGYPGEPPAALATHFWAPGWNSYQAVNKFQREIPGALRGGNAGVRLLEPDAAREARYATSVPPPFQAREDAWLVLPRPLVFGTEELSMRSQAVAERAGRAALLLARADARRLGLEAGAEAHLAVGDTACRLAVEIDEALPPGIAAYPLGHPGLPYVTLPGLGEIRAAGGAR